MYHLVLPMLPTFLYNHHDFLSHTIQNRKVLFLPLTKFHVLLPIQLTHPWLLVLYHIHPSFVRMNLVLNRFALKTFYIRSVSLTWYSYIPKFLLNENLRKRCSHNSLMLFPIHLYRFSLTVIMTEE